MRPRTFPRTGPDGHPDADPAYPRFGSVVVRDPPPPGEELHERVLSDVLCLFPIVGDEVQRPDERRVLAPKEVGEASISLTHDALALPLKAQRDRAHSRPLFGRATGRSSRRPDPNPEGRQTPAMLEVYLALGGTRVVGYRGDGARARRYVERAGVPAAGRRAFCQFDRRAQAPNPEWPLAVTAGG